MFIQRAGLTSVARMLEPHSDNAGASMLDTYCLVTLNLIIVHLSYTLAKPVYMYLLLSTLVGSEYIDATCMQVDEYLADCYSVYFTDRPDSILSD